MPDYFFHVAIELCPDPERNAESEPPNLAHFFKALKPFTSPSPRALRDAKYDRKSANRTSHKIQGTTPIEPPRRGPSKINTPSQPDDHRFDFIYMDGVDMSHSKTNSDLQVVDKDGNESSSLVTRGIGSAISSSYLKGHFSPLPSSLDTNETSLPCWGIVHLYRDADPTPSLSLTSSRPYQSSDLWSDTPQQTLSHKPSIPHPAAKDEECTTLCILAVPSYMTPADFLAFVGENTCNSVSHFRMVRTQRQNRYMVLMKFRDGKVARKWQSEWNGRVWNSMEPETCHVVFLRGVELVSTDPTNTKPEDQTVKHEGSYPRMANDPFMPSPLPPPNTSTVASAKPIAPRTSSLVELPTCPVCLERMDETTGLLTIPCQHVFHCTCLQKWSGGGCPVCRYTHDDFSSRLPNGRKAKKYKKLGPDGVEYEVYDEDDGVLECETCHEDGGTLWQCLICGKVGCGRYEGKHAYRHYEETGHVFSMEVISKRVWDYGGDAYVHRIMVDESSQFAQTKDGVEVGVREVADSDAGLDDYTGVAKGGTAEIEGLALEYTHLLTSQLESQRVYFEEVVERAVDKASEASKKAERAEKEAADALDRLQRLEAENDFVSKGRVPELEKERNQLEIRAKKLEEISKSVNSKYLEEKATVRALMERIQHLEKTEIQTFKQKIQTLEEDNATKDLLMEGLREEHRDAMVQVSAERKLREMVERGEIDNEELQGAEVTIGRRPLNPRERLRERINTERQVRAGKKGAIKEEKGKDKSEIASAAATPAESASTTHIEQSLTDLLAVLSTASDSNTPKNLQQGDKWNEADAKRLLADFQTKMLEMGLLKVAGEKEVGGALSQAGVQDLTADQLVEGGDAEKLDDTDVGAVGGGDGEAEAASKPGAGAGSASGGGIKKKKGKKTKR